MLKSLLEAGMNVGACWQTSSRCSLEIELTTPPPPPVRMNFSHGSYEYHQSVVDNARAASESSKRPVAIALDTVCVGKQDSCAQSPVTDHVDFCLPKITERS